MAWDDPVVWILIVGVVVMLFGSNKIPEIARYLAQARKEFDLARKGFVGAMNSEIEEANRRPIPRPEKPPGLTNPGIAKLSADSKSNPESPIGVNHDLIKQDDPLLIAARNEGIDTRGKTRSQLASELASKLKD